MAQNTNIAVPAKTWTQLTNGDVTSITFQNTSPYPLWVKGTTDTSAPTSLDGSVVYGPWQGERNVDMSDLFPGISGADRLWAYCESAARIMISHA